MEKSDLQTSAKSKPAYAGHRERLRRRYMNDGIDNFEPHEALELFLQMSIARRDTKPLARALIDEFGGINEVFNAGEEQLKKVKGIGDATVRLFSVCRKLRDRYEDFDYPHLDGNCENFAVQNTSDDDGKGFYIAILCGHDTVVYVKRLFDGDISELESYASEIVSLVVSNYGTEVLFFQNRLSECFLSLYNEDITAITEIAEKLAPLDICVKDFIAVCGLKTVSMRKAGKLNNLPCRS